MLSIFRTNTFKKDLKKISSNDKELLKRVVTKLANVEPLEKKLWDHKLTGNWKNCRECHIKPDLLLIYKIDKNRKELALVRIGKHSSLFK